MRPPYDDVEFVCTGASVEYGYSKTRMAVSETPREVREIMRSSSEDMIELHHHGDREVAQYVDRRKIVAIHAYWTEVQ